MGERSKMAVAPECSPSSAAVSAAASEVAVFGDLMPSQAPALASQD